jgi:membrane protein implicated in regulation of membrane protease activity
MMDHFYAWWDVLTLFQKIYWIVAIPFSLLFVLQLILSLIGIGGDHDMSGHTDSAIDHDSGIPFQFITLKNMIAFFSIMGWSGLACISAGLHNWVTILISVICGLIMMVIMASLFYFMSKMQSSGNLKVANAVGKTGSVYLIIPAKRKSQGKVSITIQNSLRELNAVTDEEEDIPNNSQVLVLEVLGENVLLVKKV